ncbi:MAG: PPC domain-containing protein, partial [Sulfurovum sp.]|nr:PPC domain-containing protein [Sulfurovum sp.]
VSHFTPNNRPDTISTATPINPNSTTQGNIEVANDKDFFKIHIPSRGTLVVETTGVTDTYGTLLDANGRQIAFNDNAGGDANGRQIAFNDNAGGLNQNFRISRNVKAGTYYVKVKHHSPTLTGNYSLVSHFVLDDYGDTRSTATPINPNSTTAGNLERDGDVDWFKIQISTSRRTLVVETTGSTDTIGELYDASGTQIATNNNGGTGNNFKISKFIMATGTYYVKVRHSGTTGTGSYALVSHFALDDHANSRSRATPINSNSTTAGRIDRAGDADWFKIQIPSRGTLVVETTGSTDTSGVLYDVDGTEIASNNDSNASNHNFRIKYNVTAGTYYVKVSASSIGHYTLIPQFISDDYGNTISTATSINLNSTKQGRIEVNGDEDYFEINITSAGTLVVETNGTTDTNGELYKDGDLNASDDNSGSGNNFKITQTVTAGTYYVKVKHSSTSGTGSYELVSKFTPSAQAQSALDIETLSTETPSTDYVKVRYRSATETGNYDLATRLAPLAQAQSALDIETPSTTPPDTPTPSTPRDRAIPIDLNDTISGSIDRVGDEDWFKVVIPSAGRLVAETTG